MSKKRKRLVFRDVEDPEDAGRYAPWVHALKQNKSSGVYVIRRRSSGEVVYIGESHTGQIYKTMTRHFQSWNLPGESGKTYSRGTHEVAVIVTPPGRAVAEQDDLITRLAPRDNVIGAEPEPYEIPEDEWATSASDGWFDP